ncbi:MAG: molybdopterin-guanine dinucleotide biosynthesis protein B [Desulfobaccales bacterium]
MAKALAIVGPSGSGKTELICRLLEWFAQRGLKVAVLKHTHHRDVGDRDKDTWRFRQAGARVVALAAPGLLQVSRQLPGEPSLSETLAALGREADLILVEGYKSGPLPKIAVLPAAPQENPVPSPQVIALVGAAPATAKLPVFLPGDLEAIGLFILAHLGLPGPAGGSGSSQGKADSRGHAKD